jgi:hypothetical protein
MYKLGVCGLDLSDSGYGSMTDSCEHAKKHMNDFIESVKFVD